jgi:hypothetical protein
MPHKGTSPRTPDLFEYTITVPTLPSQRAASLTKPPALASLSDAELAQRLGQIIEEVQRRLERKGKWPELEAAVQQARLPLDRLGPRPAKHIRSYSRTTSSVLLEGQRNAVRAALLAGVAPTQVAKHFGLPLTTVRKVLEETA